MEGGGLLVAHVQLESNFYRALLLPLLLISDNPRFLFLLPPPLILFVFLYFLCRSLFPLGWHRKCSQVELPWRLPGLRDLEWLHRWGGILRSLVLLILLLVTGERPLCTLHGLVDARHA